MKSKKTESVFLASVAVGEKYFAIGLAGLVGTTNWTGGHGIGILMFMGSAHRAAKRKGRIMNYHRMTIRASGETFQVFKMKPQSTGYATDMAGRKTSWSVSRAAVARFTGTYAECADFITAQGGVFMSEHGLPV